MAKKDVSDDLKSLRTKILDKKVIIGTERVLKALRSGVALSSIYLASNCMEKTKADIEHYAGLEEVPIITLNQTNEELGLFCKKNFFVSVLAILGE